MSKVYLVESHQKNLWFVDLWSDGSIEVFSIYKRRTNVLHRLPKNMPLEKSLVPKYVWRMYLDALDYAYFLNF
jgi:hypothetical protein